MNRMNIVGSVLLIICFMLTGNAIAAEVVQGKCLEYDPARKLVKVEEYDINITPEHKYGQSTGIVSEYDISKAKIGVVPKPGDILRIAFRTENNVRVALKVMNVTRQDLMKK